MYRIASQPVAEMMNYHDHSTHCHEPTMTSRSDVSTGLLEALHEVPLDFDAFSEPSLSQRYYDENDCLEFDEYFGAGTVQQPNDPLLNTGSTSNTYNLDEEPLNFDAFSDPSLSQRYDEEQQLVENDEFFMFDATVENSIKTPIQMKHFKNLMQKWDLSPRMTPRSPMCPNIKRQRNACNVYYA